jgi:hypothetical protein
MNAQAEDPADERLPATPMAELQATRQHWYAEMRPRLAIGLAFTDGAGQLSLPLRSPAGLEGGTLSARVVVLGAGGSGAEQGPPYWGGSVRELAVGTATGITLPPGATTTVELGLAGGGERVPFQPGARLFLDVVLESPLPVAPTAPTAPTLEPGGFLRLPLAEYGEPAESVPALAGSAEGDAKAGPLVVAGPGVADAQGEAAAAGDGPADRESPLGLSATALALAVAGLVARRRR